MEELHSSDRQIDQIEGESMLSLEVSLMNLILAVSKEIKWKTKVVLFKVSLMNFILGISREIKSKMKVVLLEVSLMIIILRISNEVK